jgi:ligand-binding sensor domain-containing protein
VNKKAPICRCWFSLPRLNCLPIAWLAANWLVWISLSGSFQAWGGNADYLTESWRDHQGIPESSVTALAQTPDGYLWVGSPDGFLRFNGVGFSRAAEFSELERLHGVITFMETDRSGRLWVCGEGRLACYDAGSWRRFDGTNLNVRSVAQSVTGQIMIGGGEGQLYTVVDHTVKSLASPEGVTKSTGVFCITDARDGQLWLANKGFIGRLTARGWVRLGPPALIAKALLAAPAQTGGLWVYIPGELRRYQADGTMKSFAAPDLDWAREMIEDRSGTIWIATITSGLHHFRPGGEVSVINVTNGLYHNAIRCLVEDREGNIWAGVSLNGLNRFSGHLHRLCRHQPHPTESA